MITVLIILVGAIVYFVFRDTNSNGITVYYDPEEELLVRYDNCGYRLIDTLRDAYKGVDPVKGMEYVEEFANCLEFARDTVIDLNKAD